RTWPVAVLGVLAFVLYLILPDHLGAHPRSTEHGGFLKDRLALLPPLLWLACFPEPQAPLVRRGLLGGLVVLLGVNLVLATAYVARGNRTLEEYTAGVDSAGTGHTLFVLASREDTSWPLADPLLHAADYYCLGTGNVSLEN